MLAGRGLPFRRMDEVWPAVGPIRRRVVGERVTDAPQRVVGLEGEVVGKPAQPVDEGEHVGDAVAAQARAAQQGLGPSIRVTAARLRRGNEPVGYSPLEFPASDSASASQSGSSWASR